MARSQYQNGCLFVRGERRKMWVARWRENVILADGSASRVMRSVVLGPVSEIGGRREARRLLDARLNPINQGQYCPEATMSFSKFVTECFEPGILPTLKFATQEIYSFLLRKHLTPARSRSWSLLALWMASDHIRKAHTEPAPARVVSFGCSHVCCKPWLAGPR